MQILTKDSTITLYSEQFDEAYHCANDGALQETLHKHILPAFTLKKENKKLKVLDMCFGLGFNTLCLRYIARKFGFEGEINVYSPEIDSTLLLRLLTHPYPKELESLAIIQALQKEQEYCEKGFSVKLCLGDAREILEGFLKNGNGAFDVIFQDPFSPLKNPSLWTYEYFKILYALSSKEVIITTYSHNSCMLYSAFLAGFYAFKLQQISVRDSIVLTKNAKLPNIELDNVVNITAINIVHKIKTNPKLRGLYD